MWCDVNVDNLLECRQPAQLLTMSTSSSKSVAMTWTRGDVIGAHTEEPSVCAVVYQREVNLLFRYESFFITGKCVEQT